MNPCLISSAEIPGLDFIESLATTLADYGVDDDQVFSLPPGIINFISYLLSDSEELEETVIELRSRIAQQKKDLRRIRAQRNGLLTKLRGHRDGGDGGDSGFTQDSEVA